jgi:hypothetical protein
MATCGVSTINFRSIKKQNKWGLQDQFIRSMNMRSKRNTRLIAILHFTRRFVLQLHEAHGLKSRNERRYVTLRPLNVLAAERGLRFRLNVEVKDAILFARQFIFGNDERSSALPQVQSAHVGRPHRTGENCRRQTNIPMSAMPVFSGCPLCARKRTFQATRVSCVLKKCIYFRNTQKQNVGAREFPCPTT